MINILLLILGGPMDMAPMIVILTPILLPVCVKLGMDPIQFGLVLIFNAGMGLLTPPVGTVLFVGCAIGKVSVNAGTRAMMPFFLAMNDRPGPDHICSPLHHVAAGFREVKLNKTS